jgi:predicted transposase YdaD
MTVLRESPWYQEILKEGLEQGRQEGWQEGRQEGRQEEGVTLILRQLTRRVGELNLGVVEQIRGLNLAQLEELAEALLEFRALEDLLSWLEKMAN